jgi:two-component system, chemotaxis family, sensor kinase CheA
MAIDLSRFHATFINESFAGLDSMEADLLSLEQGERDPKLLQSIFRVVHSIKGAAGSLGFDQIADFSHHLESLLDDLRNGRARVDTETTTLLLQSVDVMRRMLTAVQSGSKLEDEMVGAVRARVETHRNAAAAAGHEPVARAAAAQEARPASYRIQFKPNPRFFQSGDDPLRILRELSNLGEYRVELDATALPALEEMDPELSYLAWDITLKTTLARGEIEEAFAWAAEDAHLKIEQEASTATPRIAADQDLSSRGRRAMDREENASEAAAQARANTLQVSTEKVDALVNLVGELVITQTMLKQSGERVGMVSPEELQAALAQLERNTRDLQEAVLAIRMLPVSFLFGRFHRLVRDVGMSLGKKVDLSISGEGSELDKTMIEKLFDPLTHLVRNAIDHGMESPAERAAAGKPEMGTIFLHAEHRAGFVEIEVRDDGRGINLEKVRAKATKLGLLALDARPDSDDLIDLIFASGLSTADKVSDVVRENIAALSGSIEVTSISGRGTSFRIRLPLTLAIVEGMFVEVAQQTLVLPLAFIVECMQPERETIKSISGRGLVIEVRGEYFPIVELGTVLKSEGAATLDRGVLILVEAEHRKIALLVDGVAGQGQVVIKSLEANYQKVPYIAGATILGDGRVALILDAGALARTVGAKDQDGSLMTAQLAIA